jgi:signal transduction histidine kinase
MIRSRQAWPWALGIGVFLASFLTPLQTPWELASGNYSLWVGHGSLVLLLALASGVTAAVVRKWAWPLCVVAPVSWLSYSMWPTMVVASFYAALRWSRRMSAVYLAVATVIVVVPILAGSLDMVNGVRFGAVMVALTIVMPYTAGLWVRTRHQLIDELRMRNATLAAQVRAEERTRIAREMHDMVAHRVAMIVLHAGGLEVNAPDERTAREAELIRTIGREALNELRHLLGVLREPGQAPEPQPLLDDLDQLVEQTRRAGASVELKVEGEAPNLPTTVERSAYRLVQEALTNVIKHAPGAHAEVLLRNNSDSLEVTVRNGPHPKRRAGAAEPLPSSGLGLIGLRERAGLLGGEFEAKPLPDGGFQVSARLPTNGDVLQLPGEDVRRAV